MTNRLADEAAYFGAVADGAASRDDEIAELRQQLADSQTQLEWVKTTYKELKSRVHSPSGYLEQIAELRQQNEGLMIELCRRSTK